MATYNYPVTAALLTGNTTIRLTVDTANIPQYGTLTPPQHNIQGELISTITDWTSPTAYSFNDWPNIAEGAGVYTKNILSTIAFGNSEYIDGVYKHTGGFANGVPPERIDTWVAIPPFVLNTTTIDYRIQQAVLNYTTPRQLANLAYVQDTARPLVDSYGLPSDANYKNINRAILVVTTIMRSDILPVSGFTYTITNSTNVSFGLSLTTPYAGGTPPVAYLNTIKNTLTNDEVNFTFNFPNNADSTHTLPASELYPTGVFLDGVYECYLSNLIWIDNGEYDIPAQRFNGARNVAQRQYTFVTTTIDNRITQLQGCVNPNDPAQVAEMEAILAQQEAVAAAWAAFEEDPTPVNEALAYLQELVNNSTITCCSGLTMALAIGTTNQMVLSYPSLPEGEYTNQSGTLSNSLTGEEYTFINFPASQEDTQLILTSGNIGAGSSFSDGVWQSTVSFEADGAPYQCTAYALVVTNARCCTRKTQAKSGTCKNLMGKAEELSAWLETAIDEFNYGSYSVSNGFIKKINAVCSSCGCGC